MCQRERLWLMIVAALTTAACAFVVLPYMAGRGSHLTLHEMEGVTPGMTRSEVEALLGGPPGDYRTDRERFSISHHNVSVLGFEAWTADEGLVEIWFDADDRVLRRKVCESIDQHPPPLMWIVSLIPGVCNFFGLNW